MKCGLRNKDGPIFRFQFTSVSFYTHYLGHSSTSSEYCAFYTMKPDVQYQIFRVRGLCAKQRKTNKGIELILILTIFNSRKTEPFLYKRSTSMTRSLHFYHLYRYTTAEEPMEMVFGLRIPAILL